METKIHETAIVEEGAELDEGVSIGPFCLVGKGVKLGRCTTLQSNVIIEGDTEIGPGNTVYPFTSIGLPPQDIKYSGEPTGVRIGADNIIREYSTIHRASVGGDGLTVMGDNNFFMAYSHVAHDCMVGSHITMANAATLAGHVSVEDRAVIGGHVAVHQMVRVGALAMIGGFSGVAQDVPPYTTAAGPRAKLFGLNTVGLKRNGFSEETINDLKKAYKILFREKTGLKEALKRVQEEVAYSEEIAHLIEFINANKRGICR